MEVLLDTVTASLLCDVPHAKHEQAMQFMKSLGETRVFVSVITLAEIRYGYRLYENVDDGRKTAIERELAKFPVLGIDKHTTDPYSSIKAELFKKAPRDCRGRVKTKWPEDLLDRTTAKKLGIQENDLWIAAVAVQYNLALVTDDRMTRIVTAIHEVYPGFQFMSLTKSK